MRNCVSYHYCSWALNRTEVTYFCIEYYCNYDDRRFAGCGRSSNVILKVQKTIFRSLLMDTQAHCWLIPGMYQTIKIASFLSPTQSGCIKVSCSTSSRRFRRRRVNKSKQQTEITLHPFDCNAGHSSIVLSWSSCGLILGVA